MWTSFLCEGVDTPAHNKISTCSVMAEMFFSVYANNFWGEQPKFFNPTIVQERELRRSLWEIATTSVPEGVLYKIGAQQCWQHFRKKKKRKHFSYIHPHRSYSTGWPTRKLSQLTKSCEHKKNIYIYRSKWRWNKVSQSAPTTCFRDPMVIRTLYRM